MDEKLKKFTNSREPGDTNFFCLDGEGYWELKKWFDKPTVTLIETNTGQKATFTVNSSIADRFKRRTLLVK